MKTCSETLLFKLSLFLTLHQHTHQQVEVFNLLFVKRAEDMQTHLVHCLNCAKTIAPHLKDFVVLNQYQTDDLMKIYDAFTLVSVTTATAELN